ncbi:putative efflux protein, MATE family [Amphritea atlantica]|uniref:Putative efflux protein, MATE family n=1 Tax=Amphritea atlantica TaxID=355243 RepID=A0A1H9KJT9_9GAMM|nr:MATE family efflux transporter [Amphritea atlantica]SEQ99416.1 putative efflux protein, MATE family [Amphritea atlantica]
MKPDLLNGEIRPTLIKMTLPMMLGIVSLMLFNVADSYFVSRLGTEPLAALGFTFPVSFTVISLSIGLSVGTSATIARLIGSGNASGARQLTTDNLLLTTLLMVLIASFFVLFIDPLFRLLGAGDTLMPYIHSYMSVWFFGSVFYVLIMVSNSSLRACGDTRTPAMLMGFSSVMNLLLDPLLIFGWGPLPALGIQGAAIASLIAWGIAAAAALANLYLRKGLLVLRIESLSVAMQHWLMVMKIGFPAALSNMMTPITAAIMTAVVATHGPEAVAAFGVGNRLESLSLLANLALSMTLPPFISQNFGRGQVVRVRAAYLSAVRFALLWQALIYIILFIFAGGIGALFSDQAEVINLISLWILIVPLGFGFQAVTFLTASSFNAVHQPMKAMRISVFRLFILYVPCGYLGNYLAGLEGMFVAFVIANMCTAAMAFRWMQRHLNSLNPLTTLK